MTGPFRWTPEKVEIAVALWNRGESAGEIAKTLRTTRGSVCGKLDRLRRAGVEVMRRPAARRIRPADIRKAEALRRKKEQQERQGPPATPCDVSEDVTSVTQTREDDATPAPHYVAPKTWPGWRCPDRSNEKLLVESSRNDCLYIVAGRGEEAVVCGRPAKHGSSYCTEHHARCYYGKKFKSDPGPGGRNAGAKGEKHEHSS